MTATTIAVAPWTRLRIAGSQVELAAEATQNEGLEGVITRAADVEIESVITLASGASVDLYAVEQIAATMAPQFAGLVNHVSGQSWPNRVVLTCVGPLARLRRCPTVDHVLTGMTEGAAAKHILTACNVTYDAADIADSGYVLGAQAPVLWLKDQPGHDMLANLDQVFGMATIEVGAGRVVRFAYDRVPASSAIGKTYTRGVDADLWANQRDRGNLDAIVNLVQVRGATWQNAAKCSLTPWSRGSADNADLGGSARNRSMSFQSDLIQDEALAQAVATRLLRWWNRMPDEITLVSQNDPTVNCGAVIGVKDQAYGVDLSGLATATPYLVLTIDRRGSEMTLGCVGGAAGATGTITHGVEKVCNQTSSNFPIAGSFTLPTIGYPPALSWGAYVPGTDGKPGDGDHTGGGGGTDTAGCVTPDAGDWDTISGTITYGVAEVILDDMSTESEVHLNGTHVPVNSPTKVTFSGHAAPSGPGVAGADAPLLSIGLTDASGFAELQANWFPDSSTGFFYLYGFGGAFHQIDVAMSVITDGFDFALLIDPLGDAISMEINHGAYAASVALGSFSDANVILDGTSSTALSTTFSDLSVCFDAELVVDLGEWTRHDPSIWGSTGAGSWASHIDGTLSVAVGVCSGATTGQGIELKLENETIPTAGGWTIVTEGWINQGPARVVVNIYAIDGSASFNFFLTTPDAYGVDDESWPNDLAEDDPGALVPGESNPWRLTVGLTTDDQLTYAWESPIGTTVRSNTVPACGFVGVATGPWCGISVVFFSDETTAHAACVGLSGALTRYELTV